MIWPTRMQRKRKAALYIRPARAPGTKICTIRARGNAEQREKLPNGPA
jgi:hypothetical protein